LARLPSGGGSFHRSEKYACKMRWRKRRVAPPVSSRWQAAPICDSCFRLSKKKIIFVQKSVNMNALEIRGAFISLLVEVEDTELLRKMLEKCVEMVKRVDMPDDLPPEVVAALEAAELDEDLSDTVPNEEAFKTFRAWRKQ